MDIHRIEQKNMNLIFMIELEKEYLQLLKQILDGMEKQIMKESPYHQEFIFIL